MKLIKRVFFLCLLVFILQGGLEANAKNEKVYFKVTAEEATVYKRVGDELISIGTLYKNEVFPRVRNFGNWHEIQVGQSVGYIKKSQTTLVKPAKSKGSKVVDIEVKVLRDTKIYDNSTGKLIPFASLNKGISYQISRDYGNWFEVSMSGRVGYISKKDVQLQFTPSIKYFKVTIETNVYKQGKNGLVKVGTLEEGEEFPIVDDYGNWHKIQLNNGYGFVKKRDTSAILTTSIKNESKSKIASVGSIYVNENTKVFDNTSGKLVSFMEVSKGQSFEVIAVGEWMKIKILNRIGYVNKDSVTFTSALDTILKQNKVQSTQVIVVESSKLTSTKSNLTLYEKQGDVWKKVLSTPAVLGKNGMSSNKKEGDGKTPSGLYPLRSGFGTNSKPAGVSYPYKKTTTNDYWVDDSASSDYNKWKTYTGDPNKKWDSYEKLTNSLYRYGVIIGYNDQPIVKGKGSAIFLHVWRRSTSPTLGCVAISETKLVQVLKELDKEKNPQILIGTKATIPTIYSK